MAIGLRLKSTSAGEFNLLMRYLEMRREGAKLTRAEHDVVQADKGLQKHLKSHQLVIAKKEMDEENKKGYEVALSTHRLVINDFVCMRVLEKIGKEVSAHSIKLKKEIEKGKTGMPKKEFKKFEEQEVEFEKGMKVQITHLLQSAGRILNGLIDNCNPSKKIDVAFFLKRKFFTDIRLLNYFKIRYEARAERRALEHVKKEYKHILDEENHIEAKKKVVKMSHKLVEDFERFNEAVKKAIAESFKLFANATILLDRVIAIIRNQINEDDVIIQKHQIPIMMGQADKEVKNKLLQFIRSSLRDMNVAKLQLEI